MQQTAWLKVSFWEFRLAARLLKSKAFQFQFSSLAFPMVGQEASPTSGASFGHVSLSTFHGCRFPFAYSREQQIFPSFLDLLYDAPFTGTLQVGFVKDGVTVVSPKIILINYLKTWLGLQCSGWDIESHGSIECCIVKYPDTLHLQLKVYPFSGKLRELS